MIVGEPPPDSIDTEVVVVHSAQPDHGFGFYLRQSKAGDNLSSNLAMLSTIRDSIVHNTPVSIGYWVRQIRRGVGRVKLV